MKQYFIYERNSQLGPFDLEQLKSQSLKRDTPIWHDGLADWTTAENIEELKVLFSASATPPPFIKNNKTEVLPKGQTIYSNSQPAFKKKRSNNFLIFLLISIAGVVGYLVYQNQHKYDTDFSDNERLELIAGGTYQIGPFGQKATIKGYLRNTSATKNYNNATLEIQFLDANGSLIGTDYQTISEYIPAGVSKNFELKVRNLKGTKTIGVSVSSATPY